MKHPLSIFLLVIAFFVTAEAQKAFPKLKVELFVSKPIYPIDMAHANDGRLYILGRGGEIYIIDTAGNYINTPFLSLLGKIALQGEQGALSLTFHPQFPDSNYFYIAYSKFNTQDLLIVRYEVSNDPNVADTNTAKIIYTHPNSGTYHLGGDMNFGPDGMLYIGFGDRRHDPSAQDPMVSNGKMIRIDVDNGNPYSIPPDNPYVNDTGVLDEIWAFGFRNPWRFSFDRLTGDMWIGDVGEQDWEEIDFQPASSNGGENYGWPCYEGNHVFDTTFTFCPGLNWVPPVFENEHGPLLNSGCSITGGYVYRGSRFPDMQGWYIFGDYCRDYLWILGPDGQGGTRTFNFYLPLLDKIASFGQDVNGELYALEVDNKDIFNIINDCEGRYVTDTVRSSDCVADTGGAITLTPVNLSAPVSYYWNANDTFATISNLSSGAYPVTVEDDDGCLIEYTITVTQQSLNVDAGADATICQGESITLSASNAETYNWQPASGLDDTTLQNPTADPTQSTTYYLTATDSTGCSAMDSVMVTVIDTPQPGITLSNDTLLASNGLSYLWYKDGIELSGETNAYYTPVSSGNYTVEVTDANGCVGLSAPFNYTVGIANFIKNNLKLYPNPASTLLNIQLPDSKPLSVQVINLDGKVMEVTNIKGNTTLNIQHYPPGVYLLKLLAEDEVVYRKWVKE